MCAALGPRSCEALHIAQNCLKILLIWRRTQTQPGSELRHSRLASPLVHLTEEQRREVDELIAKERRYQEDNAAEDDAESEVFGEPDGGVRP
jgi:hypothetical protein